MKQSRLMSWVETIVNTAVGLVVALATQLVVFPLFGFSPPLSHNLAITAIFTVVSVARGYIMRRVFEALHIRTPLSPALLAIAAERRRQIEVEGFTPDMDDNHAPGELAAAGACYAIMPSLRDEASRAGVACPTARPESWPWVTTWWKPQDDRRDLIRAGALIAAELDRMRRQRGRDRRRAF